MVVTILSVDEWSAALIACTAPCGREDQDRGAVPVVALLPIGLDITGYMGLAKQHRQYAKGNRGLTQICRSEAAIRGRATASRHRRVQTVSRSDPAGRPGQVHLGQLGRCRKRLLGFG
jgi:hypothetical protein